jgi:hypothetical protein
MKPTEAGDPSANNNSPNQFKSSRCQSFNTNFSSLLVLLRHDFRMPALS